MRTRTAAALVASLAIAVTAPPAANAKHVPCGRNKPAHTNCGKHKGEGRGKAKGHGKSHGGGNGNGNANHGHGNGKGKGNK
jgi:hypothetical protein